MKSDIKKPLIIIGCPRSGTTLLYMILSQSPKLFSLFNESRFIFKKFYIRQEKLESKEYFDDELLIKDLDEESKEFLLKQFDRYSVSTRFFGLALQKVLLKHTLLKPIGETLLTIHNFYKNMFFSEYSMVEKTPRNCYKIQFLNELFPDAKFIYLKRDGRSNISSLIEGWKKRKGGKKRYPSLNKPLNIKGYDGQSWHFALPPGWQNYTEKSLEEVCAYQWVESNKAAIEGLEKIDESRKLGISYEDLSDNTSKVIQNVCSFAGIPYDGIVKKLSEKPPVVNTFSKPSKDKWKKNEHLIKNTYSMINPMMTKLGYEIEEKELSSATN